MNNLMSAQTTIQPSPILQVSIDWTPEDVCDYCPYTINAGEGLIDIKTEDNINYTLDVWSKDFRQRYYSRSLHLRVAVDDYIQYSVSSAEGYDPLVDANNMLFKVCRTINKNDIKYAIIQEPKFFLILDCAKLSVAQYNIWAFNITFPVFLDYKYTTIHCRDINNNMIKIPCVTPTTLHFMKNLKISSNGETLNIKQTEGDTNISSVPDNYITSINGVQVESPAIRIVLELSPEVIVAPTTEDNLPEYSVFSNLFGINRKNIDAT